MSSKKAPKAPLGWVFQETQRISKFYVLGERLGQPGQFGYAIASVHKRTGENRAIKVISKSRFSKASDRAMHYDQLRAEIRVMQEMKHPNIITLYDVFEDPHNLYIVMEMCAGGELFERIQAKGSYSEYDASEVLRQMCTGIKYMHDRKIAHCDLKPDNFLFLTGAPDSALKIIDFGMSKFVEKRKYFQTICGTPYYVAPEVIDGKYAEHCDMWSLGVVMFVMIFGYPPFYADKEQHGADTDGKIFELVQRGFENVTKDGYGAHFPSSIPCSDGAKDLIARLLDLDSARRLTADEALEHKWLTGELASDTPLIAKVLENLANFNGTCKFKAAVLSMMADTLTEDELDQLKAAFQSMDADGNGSVTIDELREAMAKTAGGQADQKAVEKLMKLADVDGDGCLSYEELMLACVQRKLDAKEERLWEAFCKLDLDGDGRVSADELVKVLGDDKKRIEKIIADVDQDGDGYVDYDEFIAMWQANYEPSEQAEGGENAESA